jgi:methyl-accepting chemotaxis protein
MTASDNQDSSNLYYEQVYRQADSISRSFMIGFFLLGVALSFFHGTYWIAAIMGGASLSIYFLLYFLLPNSKLLRLTTSLLFWNFGVQYLLQMKGLYEMHFIFFIGLTVLLFYEDWKVILPATGYALITIVVLYVWRDTDFVRNNFGGAEGYSMRLFFFEGEAAQALKEQIDNISLIGFLLHICAILFYAGLCIRWSVVQHAQTRESALRAVSMENQLSMMDTNIAFADNISQGNLQAEYGSKQSDKLGDSLKNMRENLLQSSAREEREKFANIGLARIGEILRQNAEDLSKLADQVIEEVVRYMKANQGSVFVIDDNNSQELTLVAARAWDRKKFNQKTIEIGQGLVGQAAIEKRTIFMTKVPENYISITSGLGQANPRCVLIVPLKSEDQLVGVIELASFHVYEEYEIRFLERVGESIASTVLTTKNNQRNKELLEKSNALMEQLRSQEEEIRQNMEEMQATQEEMHRKNSEIERLLEQANQKERELQKQLDEVELIKIEEKKKSEELIAYMNNYRQTLLSILDQLPHKIFLKDQEGKMALVNTVVAKAHNMSIDELIGKSDFDFVDAKTAQEWRDQELEIIRKGSETYIFDENISGKTVTLKSTKMAFHIPHLNQTGLLGIQTDITELQRLQDELKKKLN